MQPLFSTAGALALAVFVFGCSDARDVPASSEAAGGRVPVSPVPDAVDLAAAAIDDAVAGLIDEETRLRAATDFASLPPWSQVSGADPFALVRHEGRTFGLLARGELVELGPDATPLAAATTAPTATGLAVVGDELVVASAATGALERFDVDLRRHGHHDVPGVSAIRQVAYGAAEAQLYFSDPHRHRVMRIAWPPAGDGGATATPDPVEPTCRGALGVQRVGDWLAYDCMLGHRVVVRRVAADGSLGPSAEIAHDGPIWSFDARSTPAGDLAVVVGGVEDHPLDRTDGGFGFIDSFAWVYDVQRTESGPPGIAARASLNVAAHGVVTPKRVRWLDDASTAVTGYGADVALTVAWPDAATGSPSVVPHTLVPGITDFVGTPLEGMFADPLLDAWIVVAPGASVRVVPVADEAGDARSVDERLGEALVFTTLMAPRGTSEGKRSRFTCETCHFEGRTDGRTHFTGRGDVHATTKTLRGLFNNRPHFSRALDRTTAKMVHAEFRVANTGTDGDPWFVLPVDDAPWLRHLGVREATVEPIALRRAVLAFLAIFTPDPNPAVRPGAPLSATAAEGMELFAESCASCHAARLIADDPASVVPREQWERHILSSSGAIVWGAETRHHTGVEPYVHPDGPRVPSLRRLWVKRPLLTHGHAATVDAVLADVRLGVEAVHGGGPSGRALTDAQRRALGEFLDLL